MIGTAGFTSLDLAYVGASSAAGVTSVILALDDELSESLNMSLGKDIIFKGGYNSDYKTRSGFSTKLNGTLTIRSGKLTVDRLVVK